MPDLIFFAASAASERHFFFFYRHAAAIFRCRFLRCHLFRLRYYAFFADATRACLIFITPLLILRCRRSPIINNVTIRLIMFCHACRLAADFRHAC